MGSSTSVPLDALYEASCRPLDGSDVADFDHAKKETIRIVRKIDRYAKKRDPRVVCAIVDLSKYANLISSSMFFGNRIFSDEKSGHFDVLAIDEYPQEKKEPVGEEDMKEVTDLENMTVKRMDSKITTSFRRVAQCRETDSMGEILIHHVETLIRMDQDQSPVTRLFVLGCDAEDTFNRHSMEREEKTEGPSKSTSSDIISHVCRQFRSCPILVLNGASVSDDERDSSPISYIVCVDGSVRSWAAYDFAIRCLQRPSIDVVHALHISNTPDEFFDDSNLRGKKMVRVMRRSGVDIVAQVLSATEMAAGDSSLQVLIAGYDGAGSQRDGSRSHALGTFSSGLLAQRKVPLVLYGGGS